MSNSQFIDYIAKKVVLDRPYAEDFEYKHRNPYHQKLEQYEHFVLRDHDSENFKGLWCDLVFKRSAPLHLEIGTGYGHFMQQFLTDHPQINFIGLDFRFKRSFYLAQKLEKALSNPHFRFLRGKGERIGHMFGQNEVNRIYYFFPDPWPKRKHHKKRLFQKPFLENCYKILSRDGEIFIKTDHADYFQWMVDVLATDHLFTVELLSWNLRTEYPDHFLCHYTTKFETLFLKQGLPIHGIVLKKKEG